MIEPIAYGDHLAAQQAYERGELQSAFRIVGRCLSRSEDDGRAWELCGLVHYSSGNYPESVSSLERASLLTPLRPAGRVCLGHAYGRIGKRQLSSDLLMGMVDDPTLSISLLLQVAVGLNENDRPDLAMVACRKAICRDSDSAQAHYDLGIYAGRFGVSDARVEALARKAIDLAPHIVQYRVGLAGLLWKQSRNNEAYSLIRNMTDDDLFSIRCQCCLKRLIDLFEQAQEYQRVIRCQQRLFELQLAGQESDCE